MRDAQRHEQALHREHLGLDHGIAGRQPDERRVGCLLPQPAGRVPPPERPQLDPPAWLPLGELVDDRGVQRTMTFGTDWGWGASESESAKQFELFAEAGGTLIDTANRYTNGSAGTILGDLLAADR